MNYTYLLECSDHSFYCGWTNDLDKRVMAHNSGNGAKYTKSRRPVALVYYETYETKEAAMKREAAIKRMSRREKERLISGGPESDGGLKLGCGSEPDGGLKLGCGSESDAGEPGIPARKRTLPWKTEEKGLKATFRRNLRRLFCGILIFCQLGAVTAYAKPDWPADTGILAEAGVVMDIDSGAVLFSQNGHVAYPPASITKLLTALIVLEHAGLEETVSYSETAVNSVEADSGNKLSLTAGDTLTVEECLYVLLLVSSNQTANALAEHVAGSISGFVDMMNEKLAELGCTESHFDNPSGLNGDTQYVSALDMARIAQAAYQNETLLAINSADSYQIGPTINNPDGASAVNEHRLVITEDPANEYYCPAAKAGKTGYLLAAGNTLVTYGEQDGRRLVSVILKGSPRQYFLDGKNLLEFGFGNFQNMEISGNETRYVTGQEPVDINGASYQPEQLAIEPGKVITLPNTAAFSDAELSLEPVLDGAPEECVGLLSYSYNDRKIGSAYLMTKEGLAALEDSSGESGALENESGAGDGNGAEDGNAAGAENGIGENGAGEPAEPVNGVADSVLDSEEKTGGPGAAVLFFVILLAALAGFGIFWLYRRQREEAEAMSRRLRERRQRISAEGSETEAEFNRLLEEKRNRDNKKRRP